MESPNQTIKVCCISDTHTFHNNIEQTLSGDILIHSGDFTVRGSREEVQEFSEWFAKQDFKYKVVIAGNHELSMDRSRFEERLIKFQNKPS